MIVNNHLTIIYRDKSGLLQYLQNRLGYSNLVDTSPSTEYGYFVINTNIQVIPLNSGFNLPVIRAEFDAFTEPDDFETELYPDLLDNNETKLSLEDWIDDSGGQRWGTLTDNDIKAMELIEKYNKNVLLLRATKKTRVVNELDVDSGSSDVNLTGVENQLRSINEKLETVDLKDGVLEHTSITKSIQDLDLSNQTVITTVEKPPYNPLLDDGEIF